MYCVLCGSGKDVEVHHLDGNHNNNSRDNRVRLCHRCHVLVHKYLGVATADEIIKLADRVKQHNPKRHPPTLFDSNYEKNDPSPTS